ncbi:hypothetical protein BJV77DRAFT_965410 [Russula vinacea]|nr:hypothetical protein BJV77DRAFT_965410 [Russula vinacea]
MYSRHLTGAHLQDVGGCWRPTQWVGNRCPGSYPGLITPWAQPRWIAVPVFWVPHSTSTEFASNNTGTPSIEARYRTTCGRCYRMDGWMATLRTVHIRGRRATEDPLRPQPSYPLWLRLTLPPPPSPTSFSRPFPRPRRPPRRPPPPPPSSKSTAPSSPTAPNSSQRTALPSSPPTHIPPRPARNPSPRVERPQPQPQPSSPLFRLRQSPPYVTYALGLQPDAELQSSFTPPPSRRRRCYRRPSRSRSRTPSPIRRPYTYPSPQVIITQAPPPPPVEVHMPSMSPPTPIPMWPPPVPAPEPVEVLTFHYGTNMAYAPAVKTYDEAINNVLELWPELRVHDRDRIHLFVAGSPDQLVRLPKMAWGLVLRDFRGYEVVHIKVDQPPPPPQYQATGTATGRAGRKRRSDPGRAVSSRRSRGFSGGL